MYLLYGVHFAAPTRMPTSMSRAQPFKLRLTVLKTLLSSVFHTPTERQWQFQITGA
jgi:hypothetical protein